MCRRVHKCVPGRIHICVVMVDISLSELDYSLKRRCLDSVLGVREGVFFSFDLIFPRSNEMQRFPLVFYLLSEVDITNI